MKSERPKHGPAPLNGHRGELERELMLDVEGMCWDYDRLFCQVAAELQKLGGKYIDLTKSFPQNP